MQLLLVIVLLVILYVVLAYNSMVKLRNKVKEAWSDIDVQLKRRYNLIPNIIETVKGYATHEDKVFKEVTEARSNAINATNVHEQGAAENMLTGALKSLFAVAENYPELKANENFMQLQNELVDTEDKIQSARRFYNGMVRDWNTKIQQFPAKLIANLFKFVAEEYFEIEDEKEKEAVKVDFKKGEKTAEPPQSGAPSEPTEPAPEKPMPAKCPKCGGEMKEGHVCPVAETKPTEPASEAPMASAPAEEKPMEEKPAMEEAPKAPATPAEEQAEAETAEPPQSGAPSEEAEAPAPPPTGSSGRAEKPAEEEKKEG